MLPDPAPTGRHDPLDGLRQRVPVQVAGESGRSGRWQRRRGRAGIGVSLTNPLCPEPANGFTEPCGGQGCLRRQPPSANPLTALSDSLMSREARGDRMPA